MKIFVYIFLLRAVSCTDEKKNLPVITCIAKNTENAYFEKKFQEDKAEWLKVDPTKDPKRSNTWSLLEEVTFTHGYITFNSYPMYSGHAFAILFDLERKVAVRVDYGFHVNAPSFIEAKKYNDRLLSVLTRTQKRMLCMQGVNAALFTFGVVQPELFAIGAGVIGACQIGSAVFVNDLTKPIAGGFHIRTVDYDQYWANEAKEVLNRISWQDLIFGATTVMDRYLGTLKMTRKIYIGNNEAENCMTALLTLSAQMDLGLEVVKPVDRLREAVIQVFRKTEIHEIIQSMHKDKREDKKLDDLHKQHQDRKRNRKKKQE